MANEEKLRVLLLDTDSQYMVELFDVLVSRHEVCVLNSSAEALDKIHRYTPDLVVLEMDLPEIEGVDFVRRVRRKAKHKNLPMIFLTHQDSPADVRLGYMVKADRCLSKKANLETIITEIEIVIRERNLEPRPKEMRLEEIHEEQHQAARQRHAPSRPSAPTPPVAEDSDSPGTEVGTPESAAAEEPPQLLLSDRRLRLLIADADAPQLACLHSLFGTFCDCISAHCGVEAVEKAGLYLPDVLILNVRLPNLQGFEVCKTLRNHPAFREAPVFGIANVGESLLQGKILKQYGLTRLFQAPAEFAVLCTKVQNLCTDPSFARHAYPQDFDEVEGEEEKRRLHSQKLKGQEEVRRRTKHFEDFFSEITDR